MAKAVFSVKSVIHKWQPPFSRVVENNQTVVSEGQGFDQMEKVEGPLFRLVKCDGDRALVKFHHLFTLKGHEHPGDRQVWVGKLDEVNFTYLWGEDGVTKSLRLKEITE